jgi:hypothetical protein
LTTQQILIFAGFAVMTQLFGNPLRKFSAAQVELSRQDQQGASE